MRLRTLFATCVALCPLSSEAGSSASLRPAVALDRRQESGLVDASIFLRRAYHSSTVLDGWLYIDGGEFSYSTSTGVKLQYSTSLLAVDLSQNFTTSSVTIRNINKPAGAPSLRHGGLWADDSKKLLYVGFAGRESFFDGPYSPNGLWSFAPDGKGSGTWTNLNSTAPSAFRTAARRWNGQTASGAGKGFFLGGFKGNLSARNDEETPVTGMLVYDFASNTLKTNTVSGVSTNDGVQRGAMAYVPNFGPQGIIVSVGGIQRGKTDVDRDFLLSMATVQVYDPVKEVWYEQTTTGSPPAPRKDYCVAGAASTNRTYEILVYAGWGGNLGSVATSFDVAYVLSLPSFHWFKAEYSAIRPRHGLTCNSIGGGKIMTIGGADTLQNDATAPYSLYGHVFDTADTLRQGLGIFDLSTLKFTDSHTPSRQYTVNAEIQSYYDRSGRMPTFDSAGLSDLLAVENFTTQATTGSTTSSPTDPYTANAPANIGLIVGAVMGGVAAIALIAGAIFFYLRRKKRTGEEKLGTSAAVYTHVAGGGPNKAEGPYDPIPELQHTPVELPSQSGDHTISYYYGSNSSSNGDGVSSATGGRWQAPPAVHHHHGAGAPYVPYDQRGSLNTDSKYQEALHGGVYLPPQTYELQTHYHHEGSRHASATNLSQHSGVAAAPQQEVHEIQGYQDSGGRTVGEENYKYNMRF